MRARLNVLQKEIVECSSCPRLAEFRQQVACLKRRAFRDWQYWGKPVPSLGNPRARLLIIGLAPAAHGANRTGRMFTGDRSGDFLYPTLFRFGFCNQPLSRHRRDGLTLQDTYITAAIHCAPPANKPAREELAACRRFLQRELQLLPSIRVVVALGRIAWDAYLAARKALDWPIPVPVPKFAHAVVCPLDDHTTLIGSYHPSRQNTQTGRLTESMFERIFAEARRLLDSS